MRRFVRCGDHAVISGATSSTATVTTAAQSLDSHCATLTNIVVDATTGPIYACFRVVSGGSCGAYFGMCVGALVQKDHLDLNARHTNASDESYFMSLCTGSLLGSGKGARNSDLD